jgi:hypothetical protein
MRKSARHSKKPRPTENSHDRRVRHCAKGACSAICIIVRIRTRPCRHRRHAPRSGLLSDRQVRIVERFTRLVMPRRRRQDFRAAVQARLSGAPGDAAVLSAAISASKNFIDPSVLRASGLVMLDSYGAPRLPYQNQHRMVGGSKAILGTERRK